VFFLFGVCCQILHSYESGTISSFASVPLCLFALLRQQRQSLVPTFVSLATHCGASVVGAVGDESKRTLLHLAAELGNREVVQGSEKGKKNVFFLKEIF
jgi:hypothetical protein